MFGLGLAIPIGPITILMMTQAIYSYKHGFFVGLGAMSVDMVYCLLISFGVLQILDNAMFFNILGICGAVFLLYLAYKILKDSSKEINPLKNHKLGSLFKSYIKGVLLNSVNPYIIAFWLGISTVIATMGDRFVYSFFGLICGIGIWIVFFPFMVYKSRNFMSLEVQRYLAYFSAVVLLFFAFNLLYKIYVKGF